MTFRGFRISPIGNFYYKITSQDGRIVITGFVSEDDAKAYIKRKFLWKEPCTPTDS
jgi:hypothetical protein